TPADSLAGSVNLVSKSAFERRKAELRYGISMVGNSDDYKLGRTPSAYGDRYSRKIQPNADFDYTLPINDNLGLVVTGLHSNKFNPQYLAHTNYSPNAANSGATPANPFLQSHLIQNGPRNQIRNSASIKVDWRLASHSVLS